MIAPPVVLAEAVVRARDGRSILDRDAHGSAKALTADPDRLHAAVTTLEQLGLTVDRVGRAVVGFSGSPGAVERTFAVRLTYDDTGGWQIAAGTTSFEVAGTTALGGVLHRVHLVRLPPPATRESLEVDFPVTDWRFDDLFLGEINETLGIGYPPGLTGRRGLRLDTPADAATSTRAALRRWETSDERGQVLDQIDVAQIESRGVRPQAVILEYGAHPDTAKRFDDLWSGVQNSPTRAQLLPGGVAENDYGSSWSSATDEQRYRAQQALFAEHPSVRIDNLIEVISRALTVDDLDLFGRARSLLDELSAGLTALADNGVPGGPAAPDLDKTTQQLAAVASTQPMELLRIRLRLAPLSGWLSSHKQDYDSTRTWICKSNQAHATMVGSAFLAVTLDTVNVELVGVPEPLAWMWEGEIPNGQPTVFSSSHAPGLPGDFTSQVAQGVLDWATQRGAGEERRLYVISAGNRETLPDSWSDHLAYGNVDNVITVSGCEPVGGQWLACGRTHGYDAAVDVRANATVTRTTFTLPDLCATALGDRGGAVLYPTTPDTAVADGELRWRVGGGSSLATPIVAAVCALVWNVFPQFTGAQVKEAVLRGAQALSGGAFFVPTPSSPSVTVRPDSGRTGNAGARRVCLTVAIDKAADVDNERLARKSLALSAAGGSTS